MSENGVLRPHHKIAIVVICVIAALAFLYNLGIFDIWSVAQTRK